MTNRLRYITSHNITYKCNKFDKNNKSEYIGNIMNIQKLYLLAFTFVNNKKNTIDI